MSPLAILRARREARPAQYTWPSLAILGILLLGFGSGGVVRAEQTVPSGLTALLVTTVPFWMVGIDAARADAEPITTRRALGLLVSFAGIVLLTSWASRSTGGWDWRRRSCSRAWRW